MLVLSRKSGERILIGDKISVTVVRIAPGVVRIGVDAPDGLTIIREELQGSPEDLRRKAAIGNGDAPVEVAKEA
jgi:carbon storage regulator